VFDFVESWLIEAVVTMAVALLLIFIVIKIFDYMNGEIK